ncbi:adenosine receptor A2a-like [Montipora capricornis]|uniref:adenosine receptor A2a-like n=1 Tax=Montipora foliosa TaxID=591990 RepID=UPI0035F1BBAF
MSLIGLYPCTNISAPTELSIISGTCCSILAVAAVIGNVLVLLAIIIDPYRQLRSPFNFLVANLAAADLIVGCLALPMSVEFYVREATSERLVLLPRDVARRISFFISCTASLLSIAAITVDRFIAISFPMKYRLMLDSRRTVVTSCVLWIFSIGFPFLYFKVGYLKYHFFFANTAVVTTFAVLCVTYAKVFRTFKHQMKHWDTIQNCPGQHNNIKMRTLKWEKKVTQTFLVMLSLFIACFLPALVLNYVISFCGHCSCVFIHWARDINYILIMANSSMNPFVFAWRLKPFRKAFIKILTCRALMRKMRSISQQINLSMNSMGISTSSTGPMPSSRTTEEEASTL